MTLRKTKAAAGSFCLPRNAVTFRVALLFALAPALLLGGCRDRSGDAGQSPSTQQRTAAAQITVENGRTVITLDAATQQRLGIGVIALASRATHMRASYPAVVLSVEPLAANRAQYVAGQSRQRKAQIRAAVARKEYERLKLLAGPEKNVSEKALQAAEANWQDAEADARAAADQLELQVVALRHEWGDAVAKWAANDAPQLRDLLERSHCLVQLTIPAGSAAPPPQGISLGLPDGRNAQASFVSAFPRVDPRIQGRSFLYMLPSRGALAPGLSLVASFPMGAVRKGVVVPSSAVLWSEGRAWVYEEVAAGKFSRLPVSTELPVEGGYLSPEGFAPGDQIVNVGAQALLSEEILLHGRGGLEPD